MNQKILKKLLRMYDREQDFLASGQFGEGLWPVDVQLGQMMYWLIDAFGLTYGLEVGAGVGYATGWFGLAFLGTQGTVITTEYFPPKVLQLENNLKYLFGVQFDKTVQIVPTEFTRLLPHLGRKKFDFVFFDQRKLDYLPHLQLLMPYLKKGAFICADNILSHAGPCSDYLRYVRSHRQFDSVSINVGAGLEISRWKGFTDEQ